MNTDEQYLSLANEIIRDGVHCENRTGTDTLAVFGRQGRYDCSGGKLPVLTTKKLHTKSVITELLWFLRGDTNIRFLKTHGCRIWDEWASPTGDLGPVYGAQWMAWPCNGAELEPIPTPSEWAAEQKIAWYQSEHPFTKAPKKPEDLADPKVEGDLKTFTAKTVFTSKQGKAFRIVGELQSKPHQKIIQFEKTQNVRLVHRVMLDTQQYDFVDFYEPNLEGFYYGAKTDLHIDRDVMHLWQHIQKFPQGAPFSPRWKEFESFAAEISAVPGYSYWKQNPNGYLLQTGWNGIKFWHRDQCAFVPRHLATHGLVIHDREKDTRIPARPRLYINQIENVIKRIKENPTCRRLIVSAWNPSDLSAMHLPPCHAFMQFRVLDEKLHLQLYQRSCDHFLGVPFNIMSYGLLLHVVAHMTGLQPGEFVHTYGDLHLYENHMEQIRTQMGREPYEGPKVTISPKASLLWQLQREHIEISDYESHGKLVGKVAV